MDYLPLYIVCINPNREPAEYRDETIIHPLRWGLFLLTDPSQGHGTLYELSGIRESYWYSGPQMHQTLDPGKSHVVKELGRIAINQVMCFNELVDEIEIVNHVGVQEWDGKDWVLTGVWKFMEAGLIGPQNTREIVQDILNAKSVYEIENDEGIY